MERRPRTAYSRVQLQALEELFASNRYPDM
jgi:hypothetical protein